MQTAIVLLCTAYLLDLLSKDHDDWWILFYILVILHIHKIGPIRTAADTGDLIQ